MMENWAGNLKFFPEKILMPASTEEAQKIIQDHFNSKKRIRIRGSSHSWTPLITTDESFLHLDHMQGLLAVDTEKQLVTMKGGTKLFRFGKEAFKLNLALPNQGDIDQQSIVGALSTGTHGTGMTLQSMSNQIQNLTIIDGTGEIHHIDDKHHLNMLQGMAISLGALGLITEVTLKMMPAYKLKVESWTEDMSTCLSHVFAYVKNNRHFEIFYFPVGDWCLLKKMNPTHEEKSSFLPLKKMSDLVIENWLYELLHIIAHKTDSYQILDSFIRKFTGKTSFVDWSYRAFATQRTVRFMEMEYNLPIEKFEEVFLEIKSSIHKNHFKTLFPIEIRFVKGDDLWLSPAYKRDSVYFAVHAYIQQNPKPYFDEMEKIFKRHGGRPHWGKMHNMTSQECEKVYPMWNQFLQLRSEFDPSGLWLNPYLKKLFMI